MKPEMDKTLIDANKKWHQNVMNLLLGKNICGVCLNLEDNLVGWEDRFVFERDDLNVECSLKHIMLSAFTASILDIISTTKFCQKCIDIILKAFFFIQKIQENYQQIQKRITDIAQQMKWTQYLDETGSLTEIKDNLENLGENKYASAKKEDVRQTENNNSIYHTKKTHKIFLNDKSLKTILLQDPGMHRFLSKKEENRETKMPAEITVKKIMKSLDKTDILPHNNNNEDTDYESVIPNTQVSKILQSNEALIMDLMEKAKKDKTKLPQSCEIFGNNKIYGKNYLSVKLVHGFNNIHDSDDNMDIVPQDLLELKWPEDDACDAKHCMKIPVKKLNFNEALTVKFIPGQNTNRHQEIDEIAPHELLELSWNEHPDKIDVENNSMETEERPNIDLTKWLRDQGMSTIKINTLENKTQNKDTPQSFSQNEEYITNHSEKFNEINDDQQAVIDETDLSNIYCNDVEITAMIINNESKDVLRCALCCLTFDQFELYSTHYKTHDITEIAKCYQCNSQFSMIESLSEHLLLAHTEHVAYCTVCFAILSQEMLAHHMSTFHEAKVTIINTLEEKPATDRLELKSHEYCKDCKQPRDDLHTCIDKNAMCSECKNACIHEKYLSSYRNQLKANKRTFKCTDCKFKYKNKCDIIKHCNEIHLKHKLYRCKICDASFLLKVSLDKHNDLYHLRCRTCRMVFEDRVSMSKHKCRSPGATLKCELCGQTLDELKYNRHRECASLVTEECVFCQQIVPVKCNMVRHMEYVHNVCLTGSESVLYQCLVCECKFNNDKEFSTHNWVHKGVQECHVCDKRFASKALYETHFKMHSADPRDLAKLFICSVCGEQMIDKYAWANHMQGHSDHEKCLICSKYVAKASLTSHIEGHEVLETKFKCPHCSLICISHNQHEVHVNRFHLQHRPYQCDTCKKRFYGKLLLRQHMNIHNDLKCDFCHRKFTRKRNLDKHMTTHFTG